MGEDPNYVRTVGCPSIDLLMRVDITERLVGEMCKRCYGRGHYTGLMNNGNPIKCADCSGRGYSEPYILFLMHPVTTELEAVYEATRATIEGIRQAWNGLIIGIGPNHDAGYLEVWRAIKDFGWVENNSGICNQLTIPHNVDHETFVRLMAHAEVMVGNSSAGIREAGYFGTPVVDVGSRQQYRESGNNVFKPYMIVEGVAYQLNYGKYEPEYIYGDGDAGKRIANILATINLPPIQKRIQY